MPKFDPKMIDRYQYTGQGWRPVDSEAEQERLRALQLELAQRQAELEAGDAAED
jgi:hypothetical protein